MLLAKFASNIFTLKPLTQKYYVRADHFTDQQGQNTTKTG